MRIEKPDLDLLPWKMVWQLQVAQEFGDAVAVYERWAEKGYNVDIMSRGSLWIDAVSMDFRFNS